ncbi:MAG: 30S ribosomal protein S17 [Actinobacteria bacterium]|nr:30S ribosomal protein S17 [Actinomycetota bacterium]MCL6104675.1 30S ribosomal protein S17 [Actinomycetota bacterium]
MAARTTRRKTREGVVISNAMDSTVIVAITETLRHAHYNKILRRIKKLYVHDPDNRANIGDRVRVEETRPLSKLKRWRLTEILEKAR